MKKNLFIVITLFILCGCENKPKYLDVNSELVSSLYSMVTPSEEAIVLKFKYGNYKGFHNDYILAVATKNYINEQKKEVKVISKVDLENSIYSIFGKNIMFTHKDIKLLYNGICGFDYNKETENYELVSNCDGSIFEKFYHKIISAQEKDNKIIITEKIIYTVYNDEFKNISIYNNIYSKDLIDKVTFDKKIEIEDYLDKASEYEYIFEKNNGEYILRNIVLKE